MNRFVTALLFTGSMIVGLGACGEAKELYDCASICNSYGECIEKTGVDYDKTECINQCEEKSDKSMAAKEKAESCQDCIEMAENTCVNEAFQCANECAEVVVQAGTTGTDAGPTGTDGGTDGSDGSDGT